MKWAATGFGLLLAVGVWAAPAHKKSTGPELKGHLEANAARVSVFNDSEVRWTRCDLKIAGDRSATLGDVGAHDQNGTMWFKFHGPPVALDSLLVSCDEGESRFLYSNPRAPGKLRGHIERNLLGRITVFNDSDEVWHRCLLKQPDETQYLLEKLDAHSDDGVMGIKFSKDLPPATWVDVVCDQGKARFQR